MERPDYNGENDTSADCACVVTAIWRSVRGGHRHPVHPRGRHAVLSAVGPGSGQGAGRGGTVPGRRQARPISSARPRARCSTAEIFWCARAGCFAASGIVAAVMDAPSDQPSGMDDDFRLGSAHAEDIGKVVADLKKRFPGLPVFLVGTSRGTISAASAGQRLGTAVDGVVLTATLFLADQAAAGIERLRFRDHPVAAAVRAPRGRRLHLHALLVAPSGSPTAIRWYRFPAACRRNPSPARR